MLRVVEGPAAWTLVGKFKGEGLAQIIDELFPHLGLGLATESVIEVTLSQPRLLTRHAVEDPVQQAAQGGQIARDIDRPVPEGSSARCARTHLTACDFPVPTSPVTAMRVLRPAMPISSSSAWRISASPAPAAAGPTSRRSGTGAWAARNTASSCVRSEPISLNIVRCTSAVFQQRNFRKEFSHLRSHSCDPHAVEGP